MEKTYLQYLTKNKNIKDQNPYLPKSKQCVKIHHTKK